MSKFSDAFDRYQTSVATAPAPDWSDMNAERTEQERREQYLDLGNLLSHGDLQGLAQRYNFDRPINYSDDDSWDRYLVDAGRTAGNALAKGVVDIGGDIAGIGGYAGTKLFGADNATVQSLNDAYDSIHDYADKNFDYAGHGDSTADTIATFLGGATESLPESIALGLTGAGAAGAAARVGGALYKGVKAANAVQKAAKAIEASRAGGLFADVLSTGANAARRVQGAVESAPVIGAVARKVGLPGATDALGGVVAGELEVGTNATQSYHNYIKAAKENGTYVEGQTEQEALNVADAVARDTPWTNIPVGILEQGIARRNASRLYNKILGGEATQPAKSGLLSDILKNAASEGTQEYAQQIIQDTQEAKAGDGGLSDYLSWEALTDPDALYAAAQGATVGGFFPAGGRVLNHVMGGNTLQDAADESDAMLSGDASLSADETPTATASLTYTPGTGGTADLSGASNEAVVYNVFKEAGYDDNAIAGIMGRLKQEHNFDTSDVPMHDVPGIGEAGGFGMFQWTDIGDRRATIQKWLTDHGYDLDSAEGQARAAVAEAAERGQGPDVLNGRSPEDAATYWTDKFEVGQHGGERGYAQDYLGAIQGGTYASVPRAGVLDVAQDWLGKTMDNHGVGCVEAVTKIGASGSAFLNSELANGVVNVDRLVDDARKSGVEVIGFDPSRLQEGDVVVYDSNKEPQAHVMLYDGKGGVVGNSTAQDKIVHHDSYDYASSLHPVRIIKAGWAGAGGTYSGSVSVNVPTLDFSKLGVTKESLAQNQKALDKLLSKDGGTGVSEEQKAAILQAASILRDTPLPDAESNPVADAENVNEWQKLIDTKDYAGIFDKDPERVTRTIMKMNDVAKGSPSAARAVLNRSEDILGQAAATSHRADMPTRAGSDTRVLRIPPKIVSQLKDFAANSSNPLEKGLVDIALQSGDVAGLRKVLPQAFQPIKAGTVSATDTHVGNTFSMPENDSRIESTFTAPENDATPLPRAFRQSPTQQTIAPNTETRSAGGYAPMQGGGMAERAQKDFKPADFPTTDQTPVQQQTKNRQRVLQQDAALSGNPVYAQAKAEGDWQTAANVAKDAGHKELDSFYTTLGKARRPQTAQTAPMEDVEGTAATIQPAIPAIPTIVPQQLPGSQDARAAIGDQLTHILANTNIPLTNTLATQLASGKPKALRYAQRQIEKAVQRGHVTPLQLEAATKDAASRVEGATSPTADATPPTVSATSSAEDATSNAGTSAQHIDGEQPADGGRGKSAQKIGRELPDGYRVEGGKAIIPANREAFIVTPDGERNLDYISRDIEEATKGEVKAAPVRLQVGDESFGYIHLVDKHASQIEKKGYNPISHIRHTLSHFNQIYRQDDRDGNGRKRFVLYCHDEVKGFMPIDLTLEKGGRDQYYTIVSAMPHNTKIKGTLVYDGGAKSSLTSTSEAFLTGVANNGGDKPASTKRKTNVPASSIPQKEEKRKPPKLTKSEKDALTGLSNDAKEVYASVRDMLSRSKNESVRDTAKMSADLFASHADVYAKACSKATGKKYTAQDYMRDKFLLDVEGKGAPADEVLSQAMSQSGKKSLSSFAFHAMSDKVNPNGKKETFYRITTPNRAVIDVASDDAKHAASKHKLAVGQIEAIEKNIDNIVDAYQDTKRKGSYGGVPVLAKIKTPAGNAGVVFEILPNGRTFLKTMFFDNDRSIDNWMKKDGVAKSLIDESTSSSSGLPSSISSIQQKLGIVNTYNQTAWHDSPYKFEQVMQGKAQGSTSVLGDGRRLVSLMKDADASTFMHEAAHTFLMDLDELAKIDPSAASDLATVDNWANWKKGQCKEYEGTAWEKEFRKRERAIVAAQKKGDRLEAKRLKDEWRQERFARGFERYLQEGKAPAGRLASIFKRFKTFLNRIYKAFKGEGGKPSEEVARVMDRMIVDHPAMKEGAADWIADGGGEITQYKQEALFGDVKYSVDTTDGDTRKAAQFALIQRTNPMGDEYHAGIRNAGEIKSAEEAFKTDVDEDESFAYPDFTQEDGERALDEGRVKVYSSKPIEAGAFVSPSRLMAQDYAGRGRVYSKEVPVDDVAWIYSDEGQYAPIGENTSYSIDTSGDADDNISRKVFDKYLGDGIMKMVQEQVQKEISEHVDLSAMSDPVVRDKARDSLPYIKQMSVWFNQNTIQKNPRYKDFQAAKIEYARRCFDNDSRITRESGLAESSDRDKGQGGVNPNRLEAISRNDAGGSRKDYGRGSGRVSAGVSRGVSSNLSDAHDHFLKLYNDAAGSRSETQSGFSRARRAVDDLVKEIRGVVPAAKSIREDGRRVTVTMPNGSMIEFDILDSIEAGGNARADHGLPASASIRVNGTERTVGRKGFIELSREGRMGTAAHEIMHVAIDISLTDGELATLRRGYARQTGLSGARLDEAIADAARDLYLRKEKYAGYHPLLRKIMQGVDRLREILHHLYKANKVIRDVLEGKAFARPQGKAGLSAGRYSLDTEKAIGDNGGTGGASGEIETAFDEAGNLRISYNPSTPIKDETHEQRIKRRKAVIDGFKTSGHAQGGNRSAYVNLLPQYAKDSIDSRIKGGESREAVAKEYRLRYNELLANYSKPTKENIVIGKLIALRGAEYYAADYHADTEGMGVNPDASPVRGVYDRGSNRQIGRGDGESPQSEGSIRETVNSNNHGSRSGNQGGFSSAVVREQMEKDFPPLTREEREQGEKKYSVDTTPVGASRIRKVLDEVKHGTRPMEGVEVRNTGNTITRDIGASQVERFMKDKGLKEKDVVSRTRLSNGKVRIVYKAKDDLHIGLIDQLKTPRQLARRNPFVKAISELGDKAIHIQERLRNDFNKSVREFVDLTKRDRDLREVTNVILQSDAEGRNYSAAELKEMGVSERAAKAYLLTRRELDRAYKLLNEARMQYRTRTKTLRPDEVESYKENHWIDGKDVMSLQEQEDGTVLLTWRGGKTYETTAKQMTGDELAAMRQDENVKVTKARPLNAETYGDDMYAVSYVERVQPVVSRKGYFPHFFHEFMVYESTKGTDGEERLTTVGSGKTLNEAVKIGNAFEKKYPGRKFVVQPKAFDMGGENNVVIGDKDFAHMASKIARETQMSVADARAFLENKAGASLKSRHRFFGNMMKRKGAAGFETDVTWALQHYLNAASRYVAMEQFKPQAISMYERWFGAFDRDPDSLKGTRGATAKYVKHMIQDINGTPRQVETVLSEILNKTWIGKRIADTYGDRTILAVNSELSTWNAISKLGLGNVASAAVNFSQFINVGTALNDYGAAMDGLRRSIHVSEADMKILDESGVLDDINQAADNGGYSQRRHSGRVKGLYGMVKALGEKTLLPFQYCDTLMRKAAVLGAYHQGIKKGMTHDAALDYAKNVNADANFNYDAGNAPGVFRAGSVLTQQLFQFQKYPIMQFEFMYNIMKNGTRGQKVRFLIPWVLLGGIFSSLPFGDLLNQLFSFLFGLATGDKDVDIERDVKAGIIRWAGKDPVKRAIAQTAMYGVLAPTLGIDVSSRVGMSNAFSGEFYGDKPKSVAGIVAQQFGGPAVTTAVNMISQANEGNPVEALRAFSPALGNMAQAAVGESRTTHHRVKTKYDDWYSRFIHALGFRSKDESINSFITSYEFDQKTKRGNDKKDAIQEYLDNPSAENKAKLDKLGIKPEQVKEAEISQNRSSTERAILGRPSTKGKQESAAQRRKEQEAKDSLYSDIDEDDMGY